MKRRATDLLTQPFFGKNRQSPEPPINRGMNTLTRVHGTELELMSRLKNADTVNALQIGYIYTYIYGSAYVQARVDQLKRMTVAEDGLGRREIIDIVSSGGQLPSEYYTGDSVGGGDFEPISDEGDE